MARTTAAMRSLEHFEVLKGWRDELYPVYGPEGEVVFTVERAASALLGVLTYGCHLTAYTRVKADGGKGEEGRGCWGTGAGWHVHPGATSGRIGTCRVPSESR